MTLLAVERIKLFSTRSPWWSALIALVTTVGFTALFVGFSENDSGITVASTQFSYNFGMIVIMVMAALAVTNEYRFGTIKTTFQAIPNRTAALLAKVGVVAFAGGVIGEIAAFASWGLAKLMKPAADLAINDATEWRQIAGVGLVYFFAAVLAVAVGVLVRQTAAAVAILLVYTLLLENLIVLIPTAGPAIQKWLPFTAANEFVTAGRAAPVNGQGPPILDVPYGPWGGLAYFAGITLVVLAIGVVTAERRDA